MIDATSGIVYWSAPFSMLSIPYMGTETGRDYQGLVYRRTSRLLVVDGCPGEEENPAECGAHYYEWRNHRFKLVRFDRVPVKAR